MIHFDYNTYNTIDILNTGKLNDIIKRARLARVLALIVDELNSNMPLLRKEAAKKWADAPDKTKAKVCTF